MLVEGVFQSIVEKNGILYVNWKHIYVGGGWFPYMVTKYDKATGTSLWDVSYSFTGTGSTYSNSSAALSIDVDNGDNVYATGYFGDANYGPGHWGIIKIGASGTVHFERKITADTVFHNYGSVGIATCIINNTPYFVGELETEHGSYYRTKATMLKLDPLGIPVMKKYIGGWYKFPSKVVSTEKYPGNKTLVLKQTGRLCELEMYDVSKQVLWKTTLLHSYFFTGSQVKAAPNGDIYVTGTTHKEAILPPFYSAADSICVFKISNAGSILSRTSFLSTGSSVLGLYTDGSNATVVYQKNYTYLYYRQLNSAGFSAEYSSFLDYVKLNPTVTSTPTVFFKQDYYYNKNAVKAYVFGTQSTNFKIFEINKTSFTTSQQTSNKVKIRYLNHVNALDSTKIILSGSDVSNQALMVMYNLSTNDTLWSKKIGYGAQTQIIKSITDPQKANIYSIGSDSSNIVVRKMSVAGGTPVWKYTYSGPSLNAQDVPMDIAYDSLRNEVLVCGFQTVNNKREAVFLKLNTAGNLLGSITKAGSISGNNEGMCSAVLPDGTQWVGGYTDNLTGFISELSTPVATVMPVLPAITACAGSNLTFTYNVSGIFNTGNVFTAQLSDNSGSFLSPLNIGTVPATTSGSVSCILPAALPQGNAYKIRLVSSSPPIAGVSGASITINSLPAVLVAGSNSVCIGTTSGLIASGASTYSWTTGATTATIQVAPTVSTTYTVIGTDLNNCSRSQTMAVAVNPNCQDVWPGDANSDGVADNFDVLELGLHFTQTGSARATTSNAWQSYFANNWTGTISNGKNVNHSDCNGDGVINTNDTLAIFNNYGLTHAFKPAEQTAVNPQLSIVPDQTTVAKGNWGTSSVFLGEASAPVTNLNGLAFTVTFDQNLIDANSFYMEYPASFINAGNQNLKFSKPDFANGKLYTATTHTITNNVSGNGKIAILHYRIKSTLATDEVLNIGISQSKQSNAIGVLMPLTAGTATVAAIGASVGMDELSAGNSMALYPNPAMNFATIQSNSLLQKVEVLSLTGQIILSETASGAQHQLDLRNVTNGVYLVTIYSTDQKVVRKKLVVQR